MTPRRRVARALADALADARARAAPALERADAAPSPRARASPRATTTGRRFATAARDDGDDDDRARATTARTTGTPSYAFASAMSRATSLEDAVRACARDVARGLGRGRDATWAQLFVCGDYDEDAVARAGKLTRELLGGTSVSLVGAVVRGGVGAEGMTESGVALTAAAMPGTTTATFRATKSALPAIDDGSACSWVDLAKSCENEGETVGVTVFADASFEHVGELLTRLHVAMPNSVALGGVVDEGSLMFLNDDVVRRGAVALLIRGEFELDTHVAHGARPVGPVMSLTHAHDNAVLELDDSPAHPLLLETLEQLPENSKSLPVMLGLGVSGSKGPFVCRDILSVGETGGVEVASMALQEGDVVQLHVRDGNWAKEHANRVIEKCADSAKKVSSEELGSENSTGAMIFACGNGNRMHASNFRERVPGTPLGGAFLRSEIAPLAKGRASNVLSHTSTIGIYRKRKKSVSM